jgi:hypothetical protein
MGKGLRNGCGALTLVVLALLPSVAECAGPSLQEDDIDAILDGLRGLDLGADEALAAGQIDLYLYYVGYFSSYKVGMMKILELRRRAREQLGDLFDITGFHRVLLLHHRMPLEVLERVVQDSIDDTLNQRQSPRRPVGRRTSVP